MQAANNRFAALLAALALGFSGLGMGGTATAAELGDRLDLGGTIAMGDRLTSAGGEFSFVMQQDGNAVVYSASSAPQWATSTRVPGGRLVLQSDGNAVVYSPSNQPQWSSGTGGRSAGYLVMQSDGNLVIYGSDGRATWSSRTSVIAPPPPPGPAILGDTLTGGQRLNSNQSLAVGGWAGVMQNDGNFVVYANGRAQWSSGTRGAGNSLLLQPDGNAVVYSQGNQALWNSGTAGNEGSRLVLQSDGNLVLYKADGSPSWSRTTGRIPLPSDKGWELQSLQLRPDSLSEFDGTARITNMNRQVLSGLFTISLFRNGQVSSLTGSAYSVAPGQTVTVSLFSRDLYYAGPYQAAFQTDLTY